MLPVLKKANVVDAGGKGLCTIFEGMLSVFKDGEIIEYIDAAANANDDNKRHNATPNLGIILPFFQKLLQF